MKVTKFFLICLCLSINLLFTNPILANLNPRSLATDARMRIVAYDQNNVVTVMGSQLVETTIEFGSDEIIYDVEGGDSSGWTISINKNTPNLLFIKPAVDASNSNLTVVTNRRIYQFHLLTNSKETASNNDVTYSIRFTYPDDLKQAMQAAYAKQQEKKDAVINTPENPLSENWNYSFSKRCSQELVPVQAFDDGQWTYFRFAQTTEMPAIFVVDQNGQEALANNSIQGQYVVIKRIARQFSFRQGKLVSCIFNDGFPA